MNNLVSCQLLHSLAPPPQKKKIKNKKSQMYILTDLAVNILKEKQQFSNTYCFLSLDHMHPQTGSPQTEWLEKTSL